MGWDVKDYVLNLIYPRRCPLCDSVLAVGKMDACYKCADKVVVVKEPSCMRCGKPLESEEDEFCGDCETHSRSFISGKAAFLYDSRMKESMSRFKYHGRKEYASYYAKVMYQQYEVWMRSIGPEVLIPVPIHQSKLRERGYNQAALIAKELAKISGIPCEENYLKRVKKTLPQKELSGNERYRNLSEAFCASELRQELYPAWNCAILIDDIYTTGSTVMACTEVLNDAGIKKVYTLCTCIGKGY